jgi:hypothetical protein
MSFVFASLVELAVIGHVMNRTPPAAHRLAAFAELRRMLDAHFPSMTLCLRGQPEYMPTSGHSVERVCCINCDVVML